MSKSSAKLLLPFEPRFSARLLTDLPKRYSVVVSSVSRKNNDCRSTCSLSSDKRSRRLLMWTWKISKLWYCCFPNCGWSVFRECLQGSPSWVKMPSPRSGKNIWRRKPNPKSGVLLAYRVINALALDHSRARIAPFCCDDIMASKFLGSMVPKATVPKNFCSKVVPTSLKWKVNKSIKRWSASAIQICIRRSIPSGHQFLSLGAFWQPFWSPMLMST